MQEHRPKSQTRSLIIHALSHTSEMTRSEIATAIARKKSPHLNATLDQLVMEGILQCRIIQFHNGVSGYLYSLTDTHKGEKSS